MNTRLRPLLRGSTYSGVLFALCAVAASGVLLPLALAPALAWPSAPEPVAAAVTLVCWAVLVGAVGLVPRVRRVLVAAARRLLRVPLPRPAAAHRPAGLDRWRTPLWLVLHVAISWTGVLAGGALLAVGLGVPFGAAAGRPAELALFGRSWRVEQAWAIWPLALCCLLLVPPLCLLVSTALRRLAPLLLGPSAPELLALAAEREGRLAERNRVANELHDSIGHTLTAATIQAAVAGEVLGDDPAAARRAIRSVEESTRTALEDLDYVLGMLREEQPDAAPARSLADLPDLLERVRCTGARLEVRVTGEPGALQGTLSRAAYRILQEALTNALRHGAAGTITVRVVAAVDAVVLDVANPVGATAGAGSGAPTSAFPSSSRGLTGLAERVRTLHGEFSAGPDGAGAWRLSVRLPVRLPA